MAPYRTYRIMTICPCGLSDEFKEFLGRKVDHRHSIRDIIALTLLSPFGETSFRFSCVCVGWVSIQHTVDYLNEIMMLFANVKAVDSDAPASSEGFTRETQHGSAQILGIYPLADLPKHLVMTEYNKVSLLRNNGGSKKLFDWCFNQFLDGAMRSDQVGLMVAISADSDALADEKLKEIQSLMSTLPPAQCYA